MYEEELRDELEQSIDVNGLQFWIYELATICSEKAAHIEANYGDGRRADPDAFKWDKAANALIKLAESKAIGDLD